MKAIVLGALVALGVGLLSLSGASAAGLGSGIGSAAEANSLLVQARYSCRLVRVCTWRYGHRHCHYRRTCRHWY
jgi:hypothetical protein